MPEDNFGMSSTNRVLLILPAKEIMTVVVALHCNCTDKFGNTLAATCKNNANTCTYFNMISLNIGKKQFMTGTRKCVLRVLHSMDQQGVDKGKGLFPGLIPQGSRYPWKSLTWKQ